MTEPNTIDDAVRELHLAVGECILAWAAVELSLANIFDIIQQTDPAISHAVFGAIRSFEARLKMIGDAFNVRFPDADRSPRDDWKRLYNYISSSNAERNQVAHATMLIVGNKGPMLEPFFVMTAPKPHLSTSDVQTRIVKFKELEQVLTWWFPERLRKIGKARPPGFARQVPDLVLRLRDEAARSRAKQKPPRRSSPK